MSTRASHDTAQGDTTLLIACGAIAREIVAVLGPAGRAAVKIECLPPELHNRPERIPDAVRASIERARGRFARIFVAYADCGTGGLLDEVLAAEGVERLPGAHCYELFAGTQAFEQMCEEEPGTFFLTDFLARHFERLVLEGLGIARRPELRDAYFGNYSRLVFLSQTEDPALLERARAAAASLGLAFEHRHGGLAPLAQAMRPVIARIAQGARP